MPLRQCSVAYSRVMPVGHGIPLLKSKFFFNPYYFWLRSSGLSTKLHSQHLCRRLLVLTRLWLANLWQENIRWVLDWNATPSQVLPMVSVSLLPPCFTMVSRTYVLKKECKNCQKCQPNIRQNILPKCPSHATQTCCRNDFYLVTFLVLTQTYTYHFEDICKYL